MGLQIKTNTGIDGQEVFQRILEVAPGGFIVDETNNKLDGVDFVQRGELVNYNEETRKLVIDKLAVVHADTATTEIPVKKGHSLAVGDILSSGAEGGEAYAITAIDSSNEDYDLVTVGTALGSLTAGDILWLSSAEGGTSGAYAVTPNAVLKNGFKPDENDAVSVVLRGTVYERRLPGIPGGGVPAAKKTALKHIIFSQSY